MPSSVAFYIPTVLELIGNLPHQSILDIGPGFGKYGVLCREYFDLIPTWFEKQLSGFEKKNWQLKIDCIEVHEPYITPLHQYVYDNIYTGSAEKILPELEKYDLILLIGTLEHLEKEDGIKLLKECKKKAQAIIMVTPEGFFPQLPEWDNPHEEHQSGWTVDELTKMGFTCTNLAYKKILAFWKRGDK